MADKGVVVVGGVGEGLGFAIAKRFAAAGHPVAMLARDEEKLRGLVERIAAAGGRATAWKADLRIEADTVALMARIEADLGPIEVAVYNAGAQHRKPFLDITADAFEKVWRLGCLGAFVFSREAVRHMVTRQRGTLLVTGATSSLRGGPQFAAFASAKFGTRAIVQSVAREFGPQGIHAATVIIDGAVDMPAIHRMMPDFVKSLPPDGLLNTDAAAETYFQLHAQPRSAWSQEVDLRPYSEKF